jgi:hypothetical protein
LAQDGRAIGGWKHVLEMPTKPLPDPSLESSQLPWLGCLPAHAEVVLQIRGVEVSGAERGVPGKSYADAGDLVDEFGLTCPGVFVFDDQRALDYLASRPDVDATRNGCASACAP